MPNCRGIAWCALALTVACHAQQPVAPADYGDYWDRGEAEIARYRLSQSRYGEPRPGHAVLVFCAEDFRRDTQVKDEGGAPPAQSVRVLKLNRIQRFTTGIYDYSLMASVFTPADRAADPHSLKVTASIQDWCGHVWAQLNASDDGYRLIAHSYFEAEGEERRELPLVWLEDELFNVIRIDPEALPRGTVRVIPGLFDARLRHVPSRAEQAVAAVADGADADTRVFSLRYASGRRVEIVFERSLPHGITAFSETVGARVTAAVRTHVRRTAYWNSGSPSAAPERASLGLEADDIGRQ